MSWYSKVAWTEGLFLRPHHLQQSDRYAEHLLDERVRLASPYPWGFSDIEIDQDVGQQCRFALRFGRGIFPDGTVFNFPADGTPPPAIDVPEDAAGQIVWLGIPETTVNAVEVADGREDAATRYLQGRETIIDSTSAVRQEEEIDVAHPRLTYSIRSTPHPGQVCLPVARITEIKDRIVITDGTFAPPVLACHVHPVITGWIDSVIGWVERKLSELARYAADTSAGGGLQNFDYLTLQMLNRLHPQLMHLRKSAYVHPERLYSEFLQLAGELATFATEERRARNYPVYDHDKLHDIFKPVLADIQAFLSAGYDRRAIRLPLEQLAPNAFKSTIVDRNLFSQANFVIEVAARRPLTEIQTEFPRLFKVGPFGQMRQIVYSNLPGIPLIHMPVPPAQIRALTDRVYFRLDKSTPLWREFSQDSAIGLQFSGNWPDLQLEFYAIREGR